MWGWVLCWCVFGLYICWWGWGLFVWCRILLGCCLHILCRMLCFLCSEVVLYVYLPDAEKFRLLYLRLVSPWILLFLAGRSCFGRWSSSVIEWVPLMLFSVVFLVVFPPPPPAPRWFRFIEFAGLDFIWVFAGSYYFVRLVVLKHILFVFVSWYINIELYYIGQTYRIFWNILMF
jgi:hypothetical protein